jgi:hypothetical protein
VEKVIFVALEQGDAAQVDSGALVARTAELLDPDRYPDVAVQVEDGDATDRWQWRRPPSEWRAVATLAVWTECADDVHDVERIVRELSSRYAGFVVTEAVPRRETSRVARAGEPLPGVTVTSLLCRAPGLTRDEFLEHWYDVHMPMSLRIHPQRTYVRNVVSRVLTPGAPAVDAICEEGFAEVDDVLHQSRFFGADEAESDWRRSRAAIGEDIPKFLDPGGTMTSIMREYRVRDFRATLGPARE